MVTAVIGEAGAPKVVTDLTEAELDRINKTGDLTADEVLDIHNFLSDFDGDFA